MFIPVTTVKKILDALLLSIKSDYSAALESGVESDSFLYRVLYGSSLGDFDFYTQGVDIFTRTDASSRQLQTRMGFDLSPSTLPTVYVHQPTEAMRGIETIGWGFDTNEFYTDSKGVETDKLFRGASSTFEYVITSPSVLETILIYEVLYAAVNSAIDTLIESFNNITITGKELVAKSDLMPEPLFLKTIQIDADYIKEMPRLSLMDYAHFVEFYKARLYDPDNIGSNLI